MQILNILHIEDDLNDALLTQRALGEAYGDGVEITVARTLKNGFARLDRRKFDLIIADLRLPDSIESKKTIARLIQKASRTPTLILTGMARICAQEAGLSAPVLAKPDVFRFDVSVAGETLRAQIEIALQSAACGDQPGDIPDRTEHDYGADGGADGDDALML